MRLIGMELVNFSGEEMEEFNVNTFDQDDRVKFTEEEVDQLTNINHDENAKL
jgi:hypothetical protein